MQIERGRGLQPSSWQGLTQPLSHYRTSPEIIRLAMTMYVRSPLPLRNIEDPLHERGVGVSREKVRFWRWRFGPMFGARSHPSRPGLSHGR